MTEFQKNCIARCKIRTLKRKNVLKWERENQIAILKRKHREITEHYAELSRNVIHGRGKVAFIDPAKPRKIINQGPDDCVTFMKLSPCRRMAESREFFNNEGE